ncbi:ECF transporter S component [Bacillus cereus]|uniref:ECF transporter S component n=1 Tax=Bacillus cereus TaxID=1396 RepID=UPI000BEDB459|nr:ECF transporter S component [Bacillus cereus]PEA02507.1 riboflavin transporter FmnP [Bacillus cereus]
MKNIKLQKIIIVGMLSAISAILMLFDFPIPPFPIFLEIDFSDVAALIAAVTMGPVAGIGVEFFKNVLNSFLEGSPTGVPVGQISNFVTGVLFIMPVYYLHQRLKSRKGLIMGLIVGTITMAIGMSLLNYFVFMPMYNYFLNVPVETGIVLVKSIAIGILPFNIIKGIILAIFILIVFKAMSRWITQQQKIYNV